MKKLQLTLATVIAIAGLNFSVFAADMPIKAAPISPSFIWTGCYLGANALYGWAREGFTAVGAGPIADFVPHSSGTMGGGQAGCDYQAGNYVFGVEGSYDAGNVTGSYAVPPPNLVLSAITKIDALGIAAVRLGYTIDRSLFYVKGGVGWQRNTITGVGATTLSSPHDFYTGGVVGGGWEYLFSQNWSLKIEYQHLFLDDKQLTFSASETHPSAFHGFDAVLVGVNYRFGAR